LAGQLTGKVALIEHLGAESVMEMTLTDGAPLIVSPTRDAIFALGAPISLTFNPAGGHIFPA